MAIAAKSIIYDVQNQLHDLAGIRWPASDLVEHLNDGLRELIIIRPDATSKIAACALVAGAKQTVPADCNQLMDILRNTNGASVRQTQRRLLDGINPTWYTKAGVTTLKHFFYDERDPKTFYVYPPAAASGASLDLLYSATPTSIAKPTGDGKGFATVTGDIPVDEKFKTALYSYVLFRAYAKDASFGGNAAMSVAHYNLFKGIGTNGSAPSTEDAKPKVKDSTAVTG